MGGDSRLWEIDGARGVAILMMIVFHTVFDLSFFAIFPVDVATGFWRSFAYATATLFLLIVGISLVISHDRAAVKLSGFPLAQKFLLRGAGIFALGLLVTLATWLYLPQGYVVFGILHLIGVSVMLSPLFFRLRAWNIPAGILCILIGWFVTSRTSLPSPPLILLPLGIHAPVFWSVDYTPLFPWLGVVLIGMGAGAFLYTGGTRHFSLMPLPDCVVRPLSFLGRHSLVIYLVHQPVIILLLALVTGMKVW
ncbi:heparan-alpha-glucosaminide N-acetyltransferase [Methanoregula sp.]|uniref:heparan-alpha-glucosaminide N-acetyltransferase n=1 Tax=Methanoregula sp. TaxID=2052170 RepID=UPI000CBF69A4|nr:heparan-alpha-glucosaminide N-acetyltransferase [Methanoregula sp.]PKG32477.1 MAG: hypothetical protein CW742_07975 [Methanoregula sp.]